MNKDNVYKNDDMIHTSTNTKADLNNIELNASTQCIPRSSTLDLRDVQLYDKRKKTILSCFKTSKTTIVIFICLCTLFIEGAVLISHRFENGALPIKLMHEFTNRIQTTFHKVLGCPIALPSNYVTVERDNSLENRNKTQTCFPRRKFIVPESNLQINVCTFRKKIRIDARVWFDGHPTAKGIYFNTEEYMAFDHLHESINNEIITQKRLLQQKSI